MLNNLNLYIQQFPKKLEENQLHKEQNFTKKTKKINVSKLDDKEPKNRTRHPFSKKEDNLLMELVRLYDTSDKNNWYLIAYHMDGRSPRQCRERYQLFLSQGINKKVKWTKDEDDLLLSKYEILGPRWKKMEEYFPGRNSYTIKNRFISLNRKKKRSELDPNNSINKEENEENYINYLNFDIDEYQIQNDGDELL